MSDHWTPEAAQGRLDGRVKRMQDETRAFLAAKRLRVARRGVE